MARTIALAADTADVLARTKGTVVGYSVRETNGATATITIRNGITASDPAVLLIGLAANTSATARVPAIDCPDGIFVERITGETEIVLYVL